MVQAQELLDVERCSVFLIDESCETVCININFICGLLFYDLYTTLCVHQLKLINVEWLATVFI